MCGSAEGPTPEQLRVAMRWHGVSPFEKMMTLDIEEALASSIRDQYEQFDLLSKQKHDPNVRYIIYPVKTIKSKWTISEN